MWISQEVMKTGDMRMADASRRPQEEEKEDPKRPLLPLRQLLAVKGAENYNFKTMILLVIVIIVVFVLTFVICW